MELPVVSVYSDVGTGLLRDSLILELDTGELVATTKDIDGGNKRITKSVDGGANWVTKFEFATVEGEEFINYLRFKASNGYLYFGTLGYWAGVGPAPTHHGTIIRSTDNGENWSKVLTAEGGGFWKMAEDSQGNLYAAEYSVGPETADNLFSYNIYKSSDDGATWSKWFIHPLAPNVAPDYRNAIRHIHGLYIDSNDIMYAGFGEHYYIGGGKTHIINSDGTLGELVSTVGNGWLSFLEVGEKLFGTSDLYPNGIYELNRETKTHSFSLNFLDYTNTSNTNIFDIALGRDGVIYALQSTKDIILASFDNGITWIQLFYGTNWSAGGEFTRAITINVNGPSKKIFISRGSLYKTIPDYTKEQLRNFLTSTLSIKTS